MSDTAAQSTRIDAVTRTATKKSLNDALAARGLAEDQSLRDVIGAYSTAIARLALSIHHEVNHPDSPTAHHCCESWPAPF